MNDPDSSSVINGKPQTLLGKISELFSGEPRNQEQLIDLLTAAENRGLIDSDILSIILGAIPLSTRQVHEIMIPRSQMAYVSTADDIKDVLNVVIESAHSRFPVVGEYGEQVQGILLAKDLLAKLSEDNITSGINIKSFLRQPTFVPESMRLLSLLREFKANRHHMAIVIDEYGNTAGLVTIEDVLEQIVGDIEDEHDVEDEALIKATKGDDYIVKALTPIDEFNEHFNTAFCEDDFDTIGGIVMHHFGHLPARGESIKISSMRFRVLNADHRCIRLLQVTPTSKLICNQQVM
ncbi:MAG: transporter associated domain-containing protein [Gammaproteobacteria bacterium]|jgi:magnesium and cobalt transporter